MLCHRHESSECPVAFAAWRGFASPLRQALAVDAALALLPGFVAERTGAVEIRDVEVPWGPASSRRQRGAPRDVEPRERPHERVWRSSSRSTPTPRCRPRSASGARAASTVIAGKAGRNRVPLSTKGLCRARYTLELVASAGGQPSAATKRGFAYRNSRKSPSK
jgi:hypothetical protein